MAGPESTMFVASQDRRSPFDEAAAIEALEQLRGEIREAHSRLDSKIEEFDAWIRATRNAANAERLATLELEDATTTQAGPGTDAPAASQVADTRAPLLPAMWPDEDAPPVRDRDPWMALEPDSRAGPGGGIRDYFTRRRLPYIAGAAVLIVIVGAMMIAGSGGEDAVPEDSPSPATSAATPSTPPDRSAAAPEAASPGTAGQASGRRALEIELTTLRPVWMRVIVDGERRVEREVPASQRLAFGADRSIVVRAGDGGGVRLSIGGQDQGPLGRDGQIAVRTITPR